MISHPPRRQLSARPSTAEENGMMNTLPRWTAIDVAFLRRSRGVAAALAFALGTGSVTFAYAVDCYTEIDPIFYQTDVRSLIHAVTPADAERIRGELIAYIWKAPALPEALPEVQTNVANPFADLPNPPNVARIDQLTVSMDGFVSRMFLFVPAHGRRKLVIFQQGHANDLASTNGDETVRFFLERRYAVLVVHMPLYGLNTGPFPGGGVHDPMFTLESPTLSPFKYFLEPIVRAVNYARQVLRYRDVHMIGISGGGWTTTLSAALDPRIRVSVPVAGTLPLYLRREDVDCSRGELGDLEQYHPVLYSMVDYLDLYLLGSYGSRRGQLQVLNQYDSCCFWGVTFLTYRDIVKDVAAGLRRGKYDVFLDSSHSSHLISQYALDNGILPFLRKRRLRREDRASGPEARKGFP
jgi:pimeloyl-ACP methyl ester carboxylesterase